MGLISGYETAEDVKKQIARLAKGYTPEWHFTEDDPDIGSVIAILFAMQTQENLRLVEKIPERYRMEFVNMLDIYLRAAQPAAGIVTFEPTDSQVPGTVLRRGTRLQADSDVTESGSVIFETDRDLYVTTAAIKDAFMTDAQRGTLINLLGELDEPEIFPGEEKAQAAYEEEEPDGEVSRLIRPFRLFDENGTAGKSALLLWHERFFDDADEPVFVRFKDCPEIIKGIEDGRFTFFYATEDGPKRVESVRKDRDGETLILVKKEECQRIPVSEGNERTMALIALVAKEPLTGAMTAADVLVCAGGNTREAASVSDGTTDLDVRGFAPFGETLAVYNECYIGRDECFIRAGARVTLTFNVSFRENLIRITPEEEQDDLRVIKVKPRRLLSDSQAHAAADEITLEYFNGIGWKKLICDTEYKTLFAQEKAGEYKLSFICPADWRETETGSYRGRSIRMRLIRSDNCYMRPALHTYPYITKLMIDYTYEGKYVRPDRLERISGIDRTDITSGQAKDGRFTIMDGFGIKEDALWLGFDRRPEDGPVSIYFQLGESANQTGVRCRFEYSVRDGFREMRVMDFTDGFTRSGMVMFMPPPDMALLRAQHRSRYWVRVVRTDTGREKMRGFLPRIVTVGMNAVTVTNVQTDEERDYYVDEVLPGMNFALGGNRVLDAQVWVNEKNVLTEKEMEELITTRPSDVRAEYDLIGRISAFYVKWNETESFEGARDRRCYRIDRMTNRIHFSDGITCDIPRVTDDIAFKVRTRTTDGAGGNLPALSINDILGSAPFIDSVTNPLRTHGGGDLESVEHALMRGAGLMHSRERLVSADDYIRFVKEYSEGIERVSIVTGETIDGRRDPGDISIVLLMKDFADGSFSFHRIEAGLKRQILKSCELAIREDHINIVEPVFVDISVNAWISVVNMDESFEVQNDVRRILDEYLNPVSGEYHDGWPIGTLPKPSQIMMKLGILKNRAIVRRLNLIATWRDAAGEHEKEISEMEVSPFMVCRSGSHRISVIYE